MADTTPTNLATAVENMETAYNEAAGRAAPDFVELYAGEIGGKTLAAGLYNWNDKVLISENVTLSGDENDVWILQIAENLTVSSDVNIVLTGSAQAKNIFWQVGGGGTVDADTHFEGIILSMTGITLNSGAVTQWPSFSSNSRHL